MLEVHCAPMPSNNVSAASPDSSASAEAVVIPARGKTSAHPTTRSRSTACHCRSATRVSTTAPRAESRLRRIHDRCLSREPATALPATPASSPVRGGEGEHPYRCTHGTHLLDPSHGRRKANRAVVPASTGFPAPGQACPSPDVPGLGGCEAARPLEGEGTAGPCCDRTARGCRAFAQRRLRRVGLRFGDLAAEARHAVVLGFVGERRQPDAGSGRGRRMTTKAPNESRDDFWDALPDAVRRRDLRAPGAKLPLPVPPVRQRAFAVAVDMAPHLTIAIVVTTKLALPIWVSLIGAYLAVPFIHRVLLQWRRDATIGRALFGLRNAVPATGTKPSFGAQLKVWLVLLSLARTFVSAWTATRREPVSGALRAGQPACMPVVEGASYSGAICKPAARTFRISSSAASRSSRSRSVTVSS